MKFVHTLLSAICVLALASCGLLSGGDDPLMIAPRSTDFPTPSAEMVESLATTPQLTKVGG